MTTSNGAVDLHLLEMRDIEAKACIDRSRVGHVIQFYAQRMMWRQHFVLSD